MIKCVLTIAIIPLREYKRYILPFILAFPVVRIVMLNVISNWYYTLCFSPGTSVAVSSALFALVLVGRAAFVFPISNLTNCMKKRDSTKIEFKQQVIPAGA